MDACGCSESQVYIWWDFLSVSQTDHAMQKRQIECLPIFVAMSDTVCALRAGDEDFYATEGAEVYDPVTRTKVSHGRANSRPTETSRIHRTTPPPCCRGAHVHCLAVSGSVGAGARCADR